MTKRQAWRLGWQEKFANEITRRIQGKPIRVIFVAVKPARDAGVSDDFLEGWFACAQWLYAEPEEETVCVKRKVM